MKLSLSAISDAISSHIEVFLSDLMLIAEIPAPTFDSLRRQDHVIERLTEFGYSHVSIDEQQTISAVISGKKSTRTTVLLSHLDTIHPVTTDHSAVIQGDTVSGVALADNSVGVASLITMPYYCNMLGLEFDNDIVLCFPSRTLGKADIGGTRFFIENSGRSLDFAICVEGYRLGRISYHSQGMFRGEIRYTVPEEFEWSRFGASNAVVNINHILNRILAIPIPNRPKTSIVFNNLISESAFNNIPTAATLQFEIRSSNTTLINEIRHVIEGIVTESASETGAEAHLVEISRRVPSGLSFSHPAVKRLMEIHKTLNIPTKVYPSTSDLSAFLEQQIPALTIGMTSCEGYNTLHESVDIPTCALGMAQLLDFIQFIDSDASTIEYDGT